VFRLASYAGFWLIVIIAIFITRMTKGWYEGGAPADLYTTVPAEVFGYKNICVYLNFRPATYLLPVLWVFVYLILLGYMWFDLLVLDGRVRDGKMSEWQYFVVMLLLVIAACGLVAFFPIFFVSPKESDHTLAMFAVPFMCLEVGLLALALANTFGSLASKRGAPSYWEDVGIPRWVRHMAWAYVVSCILLLTFKLPQESNAISQDKSFVQTDTFQFWAKVVDRLYLICVACVPAVKAAFLMLYRKERLEQVALNYTTRKRAAPDDRTRKRANPPKMTNAHGFFLLPDNAAYFYTEVNSEVLRIFAFASFWVLVLVGFVCTMASKGRFPHSAPADLGETLQVKHLGSNTLLVFFNSPVANFVLPMLWAFAAPVMLAHIWATHLHIRTLYAMRSSPTETHGRFTDAQFVILRSCLLASVVGIIAFAKVFSPQAEGNDLSFWLDMVAYYLFQLGLFGLAMANVLCGIISAPGHESVWAEVGVLPLVRQTAWAYVFLLSAVGVTLLLFAANGLAYQAFWTQTPGLVAFERAMEVMFFILAAAMPLCQAGYFLYFLNHKVEILCLSFDVFTLQVEEPARRKSVVGGPSGEPSFRIANSTSGSSAARMH